MECSQLLQVSSAEFFTFVTDSGAGGGGRTHMRSESRGILSPVRLPVPPLQQLEQEQYTSPKPVGPPSVLQGNYPGGGSLDRRQSKTAKLRVFNGVLTIGRSCML